MHSKVALVLPYGCAVEVPQDQVMILVLSGVLYGKISEQTAVNTNDLIRPGLHIPLSKEHAPCLSVYRP